MLSDKTTMFGNNVSGSLTTSQAIGVAGMDWTVKRERLRLPDGRKVGAFATIREDTNAVLGVVGERYAVLQNRDAFDWFQPFIEGGHATLDTAGQLNGGKRVWVLAKLNRDPIVIAKGDEVTKFLLLSHGHDGSLCIRVGFTPIRVICRNTLAMAHKSDASQLIRVKHTKRGVRSLDVIRDTIDAIDASFNATAEQYRALNNRSVNGADLRAYVTKVLGVEDKGTDTHGKTENRIRDIVGLASDGIGNDGASLWSAYNGITQWLSHERGRDQDTRLDSLWFGIGAEMNRRALDVALQMVS
jgi:phage/plasmid-like protein (TIGR03299 family)